MESITNAYNSATTAASNALYGNNAGSENATDSTSTEPRNGAGGVESDDPSKPYDGGNGDPSLNKPETTDKADDFSSSDKTEDSSATSKPHDSLITDDGDLPPPHKRAEEPALDKTAQPDKPAPHEKAEDPSATTFDPEKGTDSSKPSESKGTTGDPSSGTGAQAKHQGAGKPAEEPNKEEAAAVDDERKETEAEQKQDDGDAQDGSSDPSASGPSDPDADGPGDAGAGGASSGGPPPPPGAGGPDGPKVETESKGEGTGTKYVKSSGLAADGGDFDVTNPGAGREADRLLEEKGIDRSGGDNSGPPQQVDDDDEDSSKKPSLKDRLKEKLHR